MWSRETLIPGLYSQEWYNGKKAEKGFLANFEDYLVGVPRVRMLRVEGGNFDFTFCCATNKPFIVFRKCVIEI